VTSISDVARSAGVSSATVSRVLSGSDYPVREETRQRVLAAAGALGFRPNRLARGLVTARTNIIAVIVHDISDPYFAEVVRAFEDEARARGYQLVISSSDRDADRELEWLELLLSYRVDGVIFASSIIEDRSYQTRLRELLDHYRTEGRAVVRFAPHLAAIPGVTIDHRAAAASMIDYLLTLGHREIGMLSGPPDLRAARHRLAGYRSALEAAGIEPLPHRVVEAPFSSDGGAHAVVDLLARAPELTAIFASSDAMAIGALRPLDQAGVAVPKQLSLAGFNDVGLCRYVTPPLTTVHVPIRRQASEVLDLVVARLAGATPRSRTVGTEVVVRGSTGPPRREAELSAASQRRLQRWAADGGAP
jgi:LacI family transcriptional regulator